MTKVHRSALVMHSANAMFNLVNDVVSYPQFLPWCSDSKVIDVTESGVIACLQIQKGKIKHNLTTCNKISKDSFIKMELVNGPFKSLRGGWVFTPINEFACKVALDLEFEISGRLGAVALRGIFNEAANNMMDAFCQRANEIYGK